MKLIVDCSFKDEGYLMQYASQLERISLKYKLVEVKEKNLEAFNTKKMCVECDFKMLLKGRQEILEKEPLTEQFILVAYIGEKQQSQKVDIYYDILSKHFEKNSKDKNLKHILWMSCYSKTGEINASDYIRCVKVIVSKAKQLGRSLVIYKDIRVPDRNYRYRSLTYKIVNELLANIRSVIITKAPKESIYYYNKPSLRKYEPYENKGIYLNDDFLEVIKKILPFLYSFKECRQVDGLYSSLFYEQIPDEQEIYVKLDLQNGCLANDYKELGLQVIKFNGQPILLYGKKSVFEKYKIELQNEIAPYFKVQILNKGKVEKKVIEPKLSYKIIDEPLKYEGQQTYIGVIDIDDVNYTHQTLKDDKNQTRIACIWEQKQANEGTYYFKKQINEAIVSEEPEKLVPLSTELTDSTLLFSIAGGKSKAYTGIAEKAEFLFAKINTAPTSLQKIYGGMPNDKSVLLADILVAIIKLMEVAKKNNRPLVLCIPFNGNISPHDGTMDLEYYIASLAIQMGYAFIVPTGEEAQQQHHQTLLDNTAFNNRVNINVGKSFQNVVGLICQKYPMDVHFFLKSPLNNKVQKIALEKQRVVKGEEGIIYSDGCQTNLINGSKEILFRMENPKEGTWQLEIEIEVKQPIQNNIDIWIAQQPINPSINLEPSSPFITVGSLGTIENVITVGGYNEQDKVVQKNSGRGFTWNNEIVPDGIVNGTQVILQDALNNWAKVSGTWVSASIIAGVTATLYSQYKVENKYPLPTSPVIGYQLLRGTIQFDGINYPNPSQGYGIFDLNKLPLILATLLD